MANIFISFLIFIVVAVIVFAAASLFDERRSRARLIRERLANERKAPERAAEEELALLRDEQLSKIPALDSLLRRSERVSSIQKMLAQAGMTLRAGNFLGLCVAAGIVAAVVAFNFSKRIEIAWVALLLGAMMPYAYASYRRTKRFEKFETLFPEAIDTLARAVRAGHAFTTALEMISDEVAEPVSTEFRKLYEEQKFGMPVRDALVNLTQRIPLVDVKFFVTAVMLQRETGGNLAEILDSLAKLLREQQKLKMKVKAISAEGRLSGNILASLPVLVIVALNIINRDYYQNVTESPVMFAVLCFAATLVVGGYVIIRRVCNIRV